MATKGSRTERDLNKQLALVISCETTVKAMILLSDSATSPKAVGEKLGISTTKASHHIKKLVGMGLAELIDEREVGGAIQHIYRAVIRPIVSNEDWGKLSLEERHRYSLWIVQMILSDAAKSFDAELFDVHSNRHLSRTPLLVDKEGLDEVADIQNRALNDTIDVLARSDERRARSGEEGMNIVAAMMCFELPDPSEGPVLQWNNLKAKPLSW